MAAIMTFKSGTVTFEIEHKGPNDGTGGVFIPDYAINNFTDKQILESIKTLSQHG